VYVTLSDADGTEQEPFPNALNHSNGQDYCSEQEEEQVNLEQQRYLTNKRSFIH
jgi:hypothetical protein